MKSFRDRNPYAVGLVSVLVIGALTGIAFAIGLLNIFAKTYTLRAEFNDASGLRNGDPVRVAGIKVGRVTDVSADRQRGLIRVEMVVDQGIEIHDGVRAEIALSTLLGAKYVRLSEVMTGPKVLQDLPGNDPARTISVDRTKTPYDIFQLTTTATQNIEALHTSELNALVNDLADITQGKRQSVTDLIDGINKVGAALNERDVELKQLLDRADTLSGTLAEKDQTLVALIDQSKQILDLLASRRNELATALGSGSDAVSQLSRLIGDNKAKLDSILDTLSPTLDVVARQQDHIDTALAWLGPGFYNQSLAGTHGPWLDIFINSLGASPRDLACNLLGGQPPC